MRIAIIGAGWVGCHLAKKLKDKYKVTIFDKEDIFSGTSFYNQNRLHHGFHYVRNHKTRNLCKSTFERFIEDYGYLTNIINRNIYSVPTNKSFVDFETYKNVYKYDKIPFEEIELKSVQNIEGSINTNERHIDFLSAKNYFKALLKDNLKIKNISDINGLAKNYDLLINCTNNFIKDELTSAYYELSLSFVIEKLQQTEFDSLTLVDGDFWSIFPYYDNFYTLTDVQYTPVYTSESLEQVLEFKRLQTILDTGIEEIKQNIIKKVLYYYPSFNLNFEFMDYFWSIKSKIYDESANRHPIITNTDNIINCFTGKIQGIYFIEDYIWNYLN